MNKGYRKAIKIATKIHKDQKDLSGVSYIFHVRRVVNGATRLCYKLDESLINNVAIVAALHDVVEDSDMTLEDLAELGFGAEVVEAVGAITKRHFTEEDYEEYLERVSRNKIATIVKLADLQDNMDVTRFNRPLKSKDLYRLQKYHKAYLLLLDTAKNYNN